MLAAGIEPSIDRVGHGYDDALAETIIGNIPPAEAEAGYYGQADVMARAA